MAVGSVRRDEGEMPAVAEGISASSVLKKKMEGGVF